MDNIIYNEVPKIITGKDLDYLSDMFNWNYEALKKTNTALSDTEDEEIITILERAYNMFNNNLNVILSVLNDGGINNEQQ